MAVEQDRLIVSKTDFGINIPLTPSHFTFDPSLIRLAPTGSTAFAWANPG